MNKVIATQGAATTFQATLQDFKNAFQLKGTEFKTAVDSTKGVLYVKGGQLCSANRHGGTGTVKSSVTNLALRTALIDAFQNAGATDAFVQKLRTQLLEGSGSADLDRKTVKGLISEFEKDESAKIREETVAGRNELHEKALLSVEPFEDQLTLADFRELAKGAGVIGKLEGWREQEVKLDNGRSAKFQTFDRDEFNPNVHADLRKRLFEIVKAEAENLEKSPRLSESQKFAAKRLLQNLRQTLVGSDREKPLTCDEIRRTLTALDRHISYVPPKALSDRTVKVSGANKKLALECDRLEKEAEEIDAWLEKYDAVKDSSIEVEIQRIVSAELREKVAVGRQFLRREKIDYKAVQAEFTKIDDKSKNINDDEIKRKQEDEFLRAHDSRPDDLHASFTSDYSDSSEDM